MGRTACTELHCLYKGDLYLYHVTAMLYAVIGLAVKCIVLPLP